MTIPATFNYNVSPILTIFTVNAVGVGEAVNNSLASPPDTSASNDPNSLVLYTIAYSVLYTVLPL